VKALAAALLALMAVSSARAAQAECAPSDGLAFICGAEKPEDLAHITGTPWLIASGFSKGAGLKLVDTRTRTLRRWYEGTPAQVRPDRRYRHCPGPPDAAIFTPRGISLRQVGDRRFRLYVVNHGGREAIEIFAIDARGAEPQLAWIGCLPMPEGYVANAVASYSDGTVLATVLTRPGTTITDFVRGAITGGVYEWKPGADAFHLLPGTELPGNNGLETSPDDRHFYVIAFGWHAVFVYARANTAQPVKRIVAPDFMPDNIHWTDGRLVAAGMRLDEPACGGLRKFVAGIADSMLCHRGYVVAEVKPREGTMTTIASAPPNPAFSGVSTGLIVGDTLWLGSFQADRLAYRPLERP
jgi:hypothetical protein